MKQGPIEAHLSRQKSRIKSSLLSSKENGFSKKECGKRNSQTRSSLYLEALALSSKKGELKTLRLAVRQLKKTLDLSPEFFLGWKKLGDTLLFLGKKAKEPHLFEEAIAAYNKGLLLEATLTPKELFETKWHLGKALIERALESEELSHWQEAKEAFEKATQPPLEELPSLFFKDLGTLYENLALYTSAFSFYQKSLDSYQKALSLSPSLFSAFEGAVRNLKALYRLKEEPPFFEACHELYRKHIPFFKTRGEMWKGWALLLLESFQKQNDIKKLAFALELFPKGSALLSDDALLHGKWAEALSHMGLFKGDTRFLERGRSKGEKNLKKHPDSPEAYLSYGKTLVNYGTYFEEVDFYYQAIETFQEGLSIDRTKNDLWNALGKVCYLAFDLDADEMLLSRGKRFYQKALYFKRDPLYLYDYALLLLKKGEATSSSSEIKKALEAFEKAFLFSKEVFYLYPERLFTYGLALFAFGFLEDDEESIFKALECYQRALVLKPSIEKAHYHIAFAFAYYADLKESVPLFEKGYDFFKIAHYRDPQDETTLLDWGMMLINYSLFVSAEKKNAFMDEAKDKLFKAKQLGHPLSEYSLACLYSLRGDVSKAIEAQKRGAALSALPPLSEMEEDEWLDPIRGSEPFKALLERWQKKSSS